MKPGDFHVVVNGTAQRASCFDPAQSNPTSRPNQPAKDRNKQPKEDARHEYLTPVSAVIGGDQTQHHAHYAGKKPHPPENLHEPKKVVRPGFFFLVSRYLMPKTSE